LKPEWWGSPLVQEEKNKEEPIERKAEETIIICHCHVVVTQ
jgi:hypothetical protein